MIEIDAAALQRLAAAAESRYPEECCGLLIGRRGSDGCIDIARIEACENVAPNRKGERFEIDPAVRLRVMRALAGGPESIVGHYHSHPDRPAQPSPTDIARAYEPGLVWIIMAVSAGRVTETAAFRIDNPVVSPLHLTVRAPTSAASPATRDHRGIALEKKG